MSSHVDVLIVTALQDELDAVLELEIQGRAGAPGRMLATRAASPTTFVTSPTIKGRRCASQRHGRARWGRPLLLSVPRR